MTAQEIGAKLVSLCQQRKNTESIRTLYAPDVESIEAQTPPTGPRVVHGKDAVLNKNEEFMRHHDIHKIDVAGPFPHGDDRFAVRFYYDVTNKLTGEQMKMEEIGVFTIEGDKIVREEFFYQAN